MAQDTRSISNGILEKTAEQMFPCEFCGISKNTYFLEICERILLSCYFSNLKIFCVHALELSIIFKGFLLALMRIVLRNVA